MLSVYSAQRILKPRVIHLDIPQGKSVIVNWQMMPVYKTTRFLKNCMFLAYIFYRLDKDCNLTIWILSYRLDSVLIYFLFWAFYGVAEIRKRITSVCFKIITRAK